MTERSQAAGRAGPLPAIGKVVLEFALLGLIRAYRK
jgi:hypothetical protein